MEPKEPGPERHQRETRLFAEALELAPHQRAAFVMARCGSDTGLCGRVLALLDAHEHPAAELASALADSAPTVQALRGPQVPEESLGEFIGRYKLLERLGEGGCGVVYVAEQSEPIRRRVALKVIKLGMDTREVVARFEAERQALAMMDHPNIAKVFDAGMTGRGRPFFVMELVRGIRITDYCDANHLSTAERLALFIQVCQAIQHAHQKGIIHRDIKPSNILVTLHDGRPIPKVIDFGIAKATEGRLSDVTLYTQLHQFIGTPAYMSPEQAEMSALDIDTRSDIYSLGVLLYELLSGRTPFEARELMAKGLDAIRQVIREQDPARPSTRLAAMQGEELSTTAKRRATLPPKLLRQLQGDLDWIVMKCLEKDRTRRYETANGLADDLRRHLANEPVVACPPTAVYRMGKAFRRHRLTFSAAAAVVAALVLGLTASLWQARVARLARRDAESKAASEQRARQEADQLRRRAESGELIARQSLYAANMNLAQLAWDGNKVGQLRQILADTAAEPSRGFEWYYWQQQVHLERRAFRAPGGRGLSADFSPDGLRLATAGHLDGAARIWNVDTGQELLTVAVPPTAGPQAVYNRVQFSPDGRYLLAMGWQCAVSLRDSATGSELRVLSPTPTNAAAFATFAAFSPNGRTIAVVANGQGTIVDASTGTAAFTFAVGNPRDDAPPVVFTPTGDRLYVRVGGKWSRVLDAVSGSDLAPPPDSPDFTGALSFTPDGRRMATTGTRTNPIVRLWDVASGRAQLVFEEHRAPIHSVHFSPDGRRAVSASGSDGFADPSVRVWDTESGRQLRVFKGHVDVAKSARFSPDGTTIASAGWDGGKLWDPTRDAGVFLPELSNPQAQPEPTRMRRRLAFSRRGGGVELFEVDTGRRVPFPANAQGLGSIALSEDGQHVATAQTNGPITLWERATGRPRVTIPQTNAYLQALAFSPDASRIAAGGNDDPRVRIWDAVTGELQLVLPGHPAAGKVARTLHGGVSPVPDGVLAATFSPDGRRLLTSGYDMTARIWDAVTGREQLVLQTNATPVQCAVFSPDGLKVATGETDGLVKVWDAMTGRELAVLKGHHRMITWIDFSPDGRRILSSCPDDTARLWDTDTGRQLLTLQGRTRLPTWAQFMPDGRRIITGGLEPRAYIHVAADPAQVAAWASEQ